MVMFTPSFFYSFAKIFRDQHRAATLIHIGANRVMERNRLSSVAGDIFIALSTHVADSFSRLEQSVRHEHERILINNYN